MADSSRPARAEHPAAGDGSRRQGRREWRAALRELHRSENGRPRPSTARKAGGPLAAGATRGRSYGISGARRPWRACGRAAPHSADCARRMPRRARIMVA